jgi:hypothetical protein
MLCECSVICDLYILIILNFMGCVVSKVCTFLVKTGSALTVACLFEAQSFD